MGHLWLALPAQYCPTEVVYGIALHNCLYMSELDFINLFNYLLVEAKLGILGCLAIGCLHKLCVKPSTNTLETLYWETYFRILRNCSWKDFATPGALNIGTRLQMRIFAKQPS